MKSYYIFNLILEKIVKGEITSITTDIEDPSTKFKHYETLITTQDKQPK